MCPPVRTGVNERSTRVAALARRAWRAMQDDRPLVPGGGKWACRINRGVDVAFSGTAVKYMAIVSGAGLAALLICPAAVAVHQWMYGGACI